MALRARVAHFVLSMQNFRTIDSCRICGNTELLPILHLGEQSLTGVFPRMPSQKLTRGPLELVKCHGSNKVCGLVQLRHSYYTPGTGIPIISEAQAHAMNPEYLLVMPWHFRRNLLSRETAFLRGGGKMVFPLPTLEVVDDPGE